MSLAVIKAGFSEADVFVWFFILPWIWREVESFT